MKGLATCVAIRCAPCGRRLTSGSASHVYSRFANGTRHTSTANTQAIALIRRERNSSRCEKMPCCRSKPESVSVSCSVAIARLRRDGAVLHRIRRVRDFGDGLVHRGVRGMQAGIGGLAHRVRALGGFLRGAADVFQFELTLDFAAHALPAETQAPQHRAGHARGLGQLFRTQHHQRDHRQQQQLREAELDHCGVPLWSLRVELRLGGFALLLMRGTRSRRRIGLQFFAGAGGLGLVVFVAMQCFLEPTHGVAEIGADLGQLAGAENHQHDHEQQQPMPDTVKTHKNLVRNRAGGHGCGTLLSASPKCNAAGPAAVVRASPANAEPMPLWHTVAVAIAGESMPRYIGFDTGAERQHTARTALLLVNLGTPAAPTTDAVGEYLAEFLSDPRVVELPRWLWWPVLHGYILRTRPRRSAEAYAKVWRNDGSPLLVFSERLVEAVRAQIERQTSGKVTVALAMTYGEPSVADTLETLMARGVRRVLVLPLFPQYSATST